jgi:hypothetical protein
MIAVVRAAFVVVLAAIAFALLLAPRTLHRVLDPDEPIAADGSMTAGRVQTIYDTSPILRAAAEAPRADGDDPDDFGQRLTIEQPGDDHAGDAMVQVIGPVDGSLCESAAHQRLMTAVHIYYDTRGRQKYSFSLRGPRASTAIEKVWSTPIDRRIDEFVRQAVLSGFLHKNEVLVAHYLPEFAKTFAATGEVGAGCPPTKAQQTADRFPHPVPEELGPDLATPVFQQLKPNNPD